MRCFSGLEKLILFFDPFNLLYNCEKPNLLWEKLIEFISNTTLPIIPYLMPQSAFLGHINLSHDYELINHLIPIYKFYI